MKILWLVHEEQDYGEFFLWDGLCRILGDKTIVTYPWKRSYFGLEDSSYILDDGKRGRTGPCPYMKKRFEDPWTEEEIKAKTDEFGLWVLSSPRTHAVQGLRKFLGFRKSNIPLAFCDHEDSTIIREDLIREFKPNYIFKRELIENNERIHPLPFSSVCWDFQEDKKEKTLDVFCAFGLTHPIRRNIRNLLRTDERLKKYKIDVRCNDCGDAMLGYQGYLEQMASAKINIVARGHGIDTCRRWECPTFSGLVLADKLPLIVPNDYDDGKHLFYFKNDLSDLVDKIIYFLEHDEERRQIGEAGRVHTFKYHTSIRRAEYFLSICNIRV